MRMSMFESPIAVSSTQEEERQRSQVPTFAESISIIQGSVLGFFSIDLSRWVRRGSAAPVSIVTTSLGKRAEATS